MKGNCGEVVINRFQMEDFVDTLLANGYKVEIENATPEKEFDGVSVDKILIKIYK